MSNYNGDDMNREPFREDLTHCLVHPDREAAGWRDLVNPETKTRQAVGACAECLPATVLREVTP